ncbi:MAG: 4Fe-4S dicluster domain-containing protein [Desulfobulbaceae bacterium]|jgi:formate dehydrogenase iron-sulfur subunit|nr:4Fe-4S dicluster domain-containing protein [Desulfobulbaceae bacterium]MDY0352041.1 4Fe-4S dicluster domain-containing protein [Desulfobulbaceae bacterium]
MADNTKNRKAILVSPELCIGCRACQVACKSWNLLPGIKTQNNGTYQNPPDLASAAYNIIRYSEVPGQENPVRWLFVSRRCMHCEDAGCMKICPAAGALYKTDEGAVAFDRDKCIACKLCVNACPFDVPRYDEEGKVTKCHFCFDRIGNGMEPACVKTCPTGALKYGDRNELISNAKADGFSTIYGEQDLGGLGAVYAFKDEPKLYGMKENPTIPSSVVFWHTYLKPLSWIGLGGVVAAAAIHYLAIGPHKDEEEV